MASLGAEGEVGMSDDSQEDHPPLLRSLEHATEHRFSDWPNELVPTVAAGVYTVWESDRFLYVGMAGRNLTSATFGYSQTLPLSSLLPEDSAKHRFCCHFAPHALRIAAAAQPSCHSVESGLVAFLPVCQHDLRGSVVPSNLA